jgi:hypothetical protein
MVGPHTHRHWQISSKNFGGNTLSLPLQPQDSICQSSRMKIAKKIMMVTPVHVNRQDAIPLAWDPVDHLSLEGQALGEKIVRYS